MTAPSGPSRLTSVTVGILALALLTGCQKDGKTPLRGECERDAQCAEGACIAGLCLDPEGDEDGDGLVNRIEAALGSDPTRRDSDGDGIDDGVEVGVDLANPADRDGDAKIDALESDVSDGDGDCISDQRDPDDRAREVDPAALARYLCLDRGICATPGAVTARCDSGSAICDYSALATFEEDETMCDGLDNDCDGLIDERHGPGGEVTYAAAPYPGDSGKPLGTSCGVGACTGGTVVCAPDGAALLCSTATRVGPLGCGLDMNCDGIDDEGQVEDPITDPLAGCRDFYADADEDGYGAGAPRCLCAPYGAYQVANRDDCAAADPDRYPMAPGKCGVDADCDGSARDADEVCDDQNDEVTDGCHDCRAVPRRVAGSGTLAPAGAISASGLANGGFVVQWDAGADDEGLPLGRSIAFYDPNGLELSRSDGLGTDEHAHYHGPGQLAAMASGGVAVGRWRVDPEDEGWHYEIDHYSSDGTRSDDPAIIGLRSDDPVEDTFLVPIGADRLAVIAAIHNGDPMSRVVIKRIAANGQVSAGEGGTTLDAIADFVALGFDDGTVAAAWRERDRETMEETLYTIRFDAESSRPLEDARPLVIADTAVRRIHLSRRSSGWALFFLGEGTAGGEDLARVVGYQVMAGNTPSGNPVILDATDRQGCPDELIGGFDAAGFAWALVADTECQSPLRGWYAGATTIALSPFDAAEHPDATVSYLTATRSGAGFVLAFAADGGSPQAGVYLHRYGANAAPSYLPPAAATSAERPEP